MSRPVIDDATLITLTEQAGLELPTERREPLLSMFNGVLAMFDALDAVDIGETPTVHAFDPRWGETP